MKRPEAAPPLLAPPLVLDAAVAIAVVATYVRAVGFALVPSWDDGRFIVDDPDVLEVSGRAFWSIVSGPRFEAYHPLHLLSYWLDVPWLGPNAAAIHATNIALFAVAMVLLRRALAALPMPARWPGVVEIGATLATLLVAVHPAQVEVVVWATGRKDVVMWIFVALAIFAHARSEAPNDRLAWFSRLAYGLALLAKSAAIPLPLVLLAHDVLVRDLPMRRAAMRAAPAIAIGLADAVLVSAIWDASEMVRTDHASIALVAGTIGRQLAFVIAPIAPSPIYRIDRPDDLGAAAFLGPVIVAIACATAARRRQRSPLAAAALFGLVAFLLFLAPTSNVVPLYFQRFDRYASLPVLGIAIAIGAFAEGSPARHRALARAATGVAVLALAARTFAYEAAWTDDHTLWRYATATEPRAFYAWMKLGEVERAHDPDAAIAAYERAIALEPTFKLGHAGLFFATAIRDEQRNELAPNAQQLAERYHAALGDSGSLRELGAEMLERGYRDAALLALGRSFDLEPLPDERLEAAALVQLQRGHEFLARFYVSRMRGAPVDPQLRELR